MDILIHRQSRINIYSLFDRFTDKLGPEVVFAHSYFYELSTSGLAIKSNHLFEATTILVLIQVTYEQI